MHSTMTAGARLLPPEVRIDDAVVWITRGAGMVGHGGWTVEIHGTDRLRRASALWQEIAGGLPDRLVCFVSSVFDEASPTPTVLRIPEVLETLGPDGRTTVTQGVDAGRLTAAADAHGPATVTAAAVFAPPAGDTLTREGYADAVRAALGEIARGRVRKVVLCRDELVLAAEQACAAALNRLAERFPECWTFAVGGLFGATPEMLATRHRGVVTSRVLAGSLPRGLAASDEEQQRRLSTEGGFAAEHAYAARSVVERLAPLVALDDDAPQPFVLELPNIYHLATDVRGTVADPATTVLDLVDAIHPTAAVAGVPREAALDVIAAIEPRDRGRYAGPVGWMDSTGDGEIGLALRCGLHEPDGVRVYAGGGIVAGARPEDEVIETVSKMAPMMTALESSA